MRASAVPCLFCRVVGGRKSDIGMYTYMLYWWMEYSVCNYRTADELFTVEEGCTRRAEISGPSALFTLSCD